jgi:hypothetical protein
MILQILHPLQGYKGIASAQSATPGAAHQIADDVLASGGVSEDCAAGRKRSEWRLEMPDGIYRWVCQVLERDRAPHHENFMNNRSQAVRLPKEFQFDVTEVFIRKGR